LVTDNQLIIKVLVCDYVHSDLLTGLAQMGFHVVYAPEIENQEVRDWLPFMEGVIINTRTPLRKPLLERCPELRFIGRLGVGLDIIDMDVARRRGIKVINTPGANANAVAEHMFGMLLALFRKIPAADRSVKEGKWLREQHRGRELKGLTVGVIGFGNTGSAFAGKFANWQTQVMSYDKYKTHYADHIRFVEETTLERVIEESDILSLHVPLTDITKGMVNSAFLNACRRGVVLLNGSRGKVVDTEALVEALQSGHVSGACLDVLENEKLITYSEREKAHFASLKSMDNVILSPHIAGWTGLSKVNIARQILVGISNLYNIKYVRSENVS
jgi:D-3-phosphoglycerate dehydrogenase / 2-oxoglutarate reductase